MFLSRSLALTWPLCRSPFCVRRSLMWRDQGLPLCATVRSLIPISPVHIDALAAIPSAPRTLNQDNHADASDSRNECTGEPRQRKETLLRYSSADLSSAGGYLANEPSAAPRSLSVHIYRSCRTIRAYLLHSCPIGWVNRGMFLVRIAAARQAGDLSLGVFAFFPLRKR